MIDNDYFDDRSLCTIEAKQVQNSGKDVINCYLYPNPAINWSDFSYSAKGKECTLLQICNLLGIPIQTYKLNSDEGIVRIDTHIVVSGIYCVKLFSEDQLLGVTNLVVAK